MKLQEPIQIKSLRLKNRIAMAPLLNYPRNDDGSVTDLTLRWYEMRAQGGVGFIMHGPAFILPPMIPAFIRQNDIIRKSGCKIGVQVVGPGPMSGSGPSLPPYPDAAHGRFGISEFETGQYNKVHEFTTEEVEKMEDTLAGLAKNAKDAGFDCVELHATHGAASMASAFISPYYNRRTDKYGGSWENRTRFACNVIRNIRKLVGNDYPVFVRISADNLLGPKGVTIEDTCNCVVPALEKAGVDCFDVSQGSMIHSPQGIILPGYYPRGCFIQLAEAVKKATQLPVIGVGRIVDMEMAERFLQEGKADIIYMGRQLTCDPETPKKYFEGRPEDIRKCIGCVYTEPIPGGQGICGRPCAINYDIQDNPIPLTTVATPKKVLIIGGGVGGMEAARIAAMRGHKVTLVEKEAELGGMVAALARTKLTSEFQNIIDYLTTQMKKLKIDVRVCKTLEASDVKSFKPDAVIVACGSSMVVPDIAKGKPGVMNHIEACNNQRNIGQRVVIWGLVAAELAISLAEAGKDVVMIGRGGEETLARDYPYSRRFYIMRKLTDVNIPRETPEAQKVSNPQVIYHVDVEAIDSGHIHLKDKDEGKQIISYDTLIISRERTANNSLFNALEGKVPEIYKIGDCAEVADIKRAIWQANEVARKI